MWLFTWRSERDTPRERSEIRMVDVDVSQTKRRLSNRSTAGDSPFQEHRTRDSRTETLTQPRAPRSVLKCNNEPCSRLTILFASATGFAECKLPPRAGESRQKAQHIARTVVVVQAVLQQSATTTLRTR
ncbi:hypothetical protein HN011_006958 [Eciton burchellii]|nr:hypothetical protein HN011_006958 [Eciton burchellii]